MSDGLDGDRILAAAREIAFPRYPGSEGDVRAVDIVARRLAECGLEVRKERFSYDLRPALLGLRLMLIGSAVSVLGASLLATRSTLFGLLVLLGGLGAGGLLLAWSPGAAAIYRRPGPTETANVIGTRRAGAPALTLILLAHHDSKSQNLTFPARMGMTLAAILGTLVLAGTLVAGLLAGRAPGPGWLPQASGVAAAAALLVLSTLHSGNESPGGVDNAGSVGILCELARTLPARVPPGVELIFLSTGAEEDHMVGGMRWLDAHHRELGGRPVYALNLDGAGSPGSTVVIERYGFGRRFSPTLSRVARDQATLLGLRTRYICMPPAIGIDAIPFAHRGVDCLTFSSGSLGRATIAVHSAGDVAGHLDREALLRVARLVRGVAEQLCRETASGIGPRGSGKNRSL